MKHKHEEYTKFLDQYIEALTDKDTGEVFLKSLLANEATLERHKPQLTSWTVGIVDSIWCGECGEFKYDFPCPTYTGVTDQLDLAMGVSNG